MNGTYQQLKLALKPLGDYKESYHQLKFDCPLCRKSGQGFSKTNLEVKYMNQPFGGVMHCWACSYSGSVWKLIKDFGNKEYLSLFGGDRLNLEDKKEKPSLLELPKHIFSAANNQEAVNYLLGRGITKDIINKRQIKFCYSGDFKDAIIFPSYNTKEELTAFVIHFFKQKRYEVRKSPSFISFYESHIDKRSPIALVEGVYDCLSIPNSIPLLGTTISEALLNALSNTHVIYIPDSDVRISLRKQIIKQLEAVCQNVSYYKTNSIYKDINEAYIGNKLELINSLKQFYIN